MSYHIHTPEGAYGNRIPWSERHTSPRHSPYANSAPTSPLQHAFGGISPEEQEQLDKEAAFRQHQMKLCRTPGSPPTPTPEGAPVRPPLFARAWGRGVEGVDLVWRKAKGIGNGAKEEYKRTVFACERWYWLNLTAYQQSTWPGTLRLVRKVILWALLLAFVGTLAWMKYLGLQDRERERQQRQIVFMDVPSYKALIHGQKYTEQTDAEDLWEKLGAWWEALFGA
ncbi:hypothetical protein GGS26DRAFT_317853 [Hypomontagnella submonticulosa]|nr:hypothetical protein GGS26DRAFT_317853 [Hypomontagnella submonticulosa]